MTINYLNGTEKISISGDLEKGFFIHYGIHHYRLLDCWVPTCTAGPYRTAGEAIRMLKKHRPEACAQAYVPEWQYA